MPLAKTLICGTQALLKDGESWPTDLTTGQSVTLDFAYAPKDGTGGHNEADVALSNGIVFKAGADYDFAGVKPTEVDKTATIHATGTITGDSGTEYQGSTGNLTVQDL